MDIKCYTCADILSLERNLQWVFPEEYVLQRFNFPPAVVERCRDRDLAASEARGVNGSLFVIPCRASTSDLVFGSDGRFAMSVRYSQEEAPAKVVLLFVAMDAETERRLLSHDYLNMLRKNQGLPAAWSLAAAPVNAFRDIDRGKNRRDGLPSLANGGSCRKVALLAVACLVVVGMISGASVLAWYLYSRR